MAGAGGSGSCLDSVTRAPEVFGPASKAASFAQSDLGPFLVAMVATPLDDVEASFDLMVTRLAACNGTTDAAGFTTAIEPFDLPRIGAATFAVRATARNPNGSTLSYVLALARTGTALVVAAHILTLGELDVPLVQHILHTMVGRA